MSTAAPFFCVVSRGSSERTIEAEWPDGTAEIVETFADCFEALRWSGTQCAAWIDQRLTVKEGPSFAAVGFPAKDSRRDIAKRIFDALCAKYPEKCMSSEHFGPRSGNLREYLAHLV